MPVYVSLLLIEFFFRTVILNYLFLKSRIFMSLRFLVLLNCSGFSDLCRVVDSVLCSLGKWVSPLCSSRLVSRDQPCRGNVVSNPEIPVLSSGARCYFQVVQSWWVGLGWGGGSCHLTLLLCSLGNGGWQTDLSSLSSVSPPNPEIRHRVHLSLRDKMCLSYWFSGLQIVSLQPSTHRYTFSSLAGWRAVARLHGLAFLFAMAPLQFVPTQITGHSCSPGWPPLQGFSLTLCIQAVGRYFFPIPMFSIFSEVQKK